MTEGDLKLLLLVLKVAIMIVKEEVAVALRVWKKINDAVNDVVDNITLKIWT